MTDNNLLPKIVLKKSKKINLSWIYSHQVVAPTTKLPPGSLVQITDSEGIALGVGFYNGRTRIALRVLSTRPDEIINEDFFYNRFLLAKNLRQNILGSQTDVARLVHSEGDLLSGLVIDIFGKYLVIEWFSAGMFRHREMIKGALQKIFPDHTIYWYAEKRVQKQESFDCWELPVPEPFVGLENGLRFKINIGSHRKTGFFADQRENREFLAALCQNAQVADLCCHTGAFSIYAKKLGQAAQVTAVDLDADSLKLVEENAQMNGVAINTEQCDVYQWLRYALETKRRFDVVILDPPKQTRDPKLIEEALNKYVALNRLAMEVVKPGGILVTCSCSGLISETQFAEAIKRAAFHCGRTAQIFRTSGAGLDHPFVVEAPESRYLKTIWARIIDL